MSGTLNTIYQNISFALRSHTNQLVNIQEQIATGSRINRTSDAPADAYQILNLKSEKRSLETYNKSLTEISLTLTSSSLVIQEIMDSLSDVRTELIQITSETYNADQRPGTAEGINDVLEYILARANTKHRGQYLFAGNNSSVAPYTAERENGKITRVTYQGSLDNPSVGVARGVSASALAVGEQIFKSHNRQAPIFSGNTGAKPGSGTSSVTGDTWLTVTHDGTNYKLSIDGGQSFTTVPVGGLANQSVTHDETGEVLYVDSTNLQAEGTELVRNPGTYDILNTLVSIRDILSNKHELPEEQLKELRKSALESLEEVSTLASEQSVAVGAKIGFLEDLSGNIEQIRNNCEDQTTKIEQADIAQLAIDLSRQEVLYQMSLAIAGKLLSVSLVNFIS